MKKLKDFLNINSPRKLALINTLIFILIAAVLYFALPVVLNYPPNSIDNQFQIDIVGIKYTNQFLILITILVVLLYSTLRIIYGKLSLENVENKKDPKSYIQNIRKKSFNYPYLMLILEIFVPAIIVALLLVVFHTEFSLLLRISTVIFSFSSVFAIFSYMINKKFFINKLVQTSSLFDNTINGIRLNLFVKLLVQILPLFLYSFVIILLVCTSLMTTEKGNLLYHFYHQEITNKFSSKEVYTIEEIEQNLNEIELKSEDDHIFIFSVEDGSVFLSSQELNPFFIQYTMNFYNTTDGHIYENYGQNVEGACIRIHTEQGDCFIGIRYYVFSTSFVAPFIIIAVLLILVNCFFILYIGKDLSNDIKNVSNRLTTISKSEDITNVGSLPLTSNDEIGDLTSAYNKVQTLTKEHIIEIKKNQDSLMERERLASLGQLIGGIAHNLKTPIMSISGATEGLIDLIKEYEASIEDPEVTPQDHHDIAHDMNSWISKIREYTEYMSDVITAVKGQAVSLSSDENIQFNIDELLKRVNILMRHELKNALISLDIENHVSNNIYLKGDVNSLVQVINNMISNSIQAYNGKTNQHITLSTTIVDNMLHIEIQDYGQGMTQEVKDKLFKEMITTKGKNGTGLGLFMSYSTVKAHFNGDIIFESEYGKGTTFTIILPIR